MPENQQKEFTERVLEQFPKKCVPDTERLCQHISQTVGRLERSFSLGKQTEDELIELAKAKAESVDRLCLLGQERDGTRTKCQFGTLAVPLVVPRVN